MNSQYALVITNPAKLPGFRSMMDADQLDSERALDYVMEGYPEPFNVRRHNPNWTVRIFFVRKCPL